MFPAPAEPPPPPARAPRRPAVLDAARTALIPLRPLTIGEILDGGFLVVRRNARLMVGLPLVVAGGTAAYVLAGVGLWLLLGNTTVPGVQIALVVLMGLLGLFALNQCLVWMTAILSRVSLQTVLGEGFAPSVSPVTFRSSLPLFWPVLGLSVLQYLALGVVQTALTVLFYLLTIGLAVIAGDSEVGLVLITVALSLLGYLTAALSYGYLSLPVPALAAESEHAPGWIGKPLRATNVLTAFARSFRLIGSGNLVRAGLVYSGALTVSLGLVGLLAVGALALLLLFATSINADFYAVLTSPWTVFGVLAFAVVVAMSGLLAYLAAVQTLLYLDLRMRREALDLAMRFDRVPIPQPTAPPPVFYPPGFHLPPGFFPAAPPGAGR